MKSWTLNPTPTKCNTFCCALDIHLNGVKSCILQVSFEHVRNTIKQFYYRYPQKLRQVTVVKIENNSRLPTQAELRKNEAKSKASVEKAKKEENQPTDMS